VVGAKPPATVVDDVLARRTVVGSHDCELVTVRSSGMLVTPSLGWGTEVVGMGSVPLLLTVGCVMGGGVTVGVVVGVTSGPLVVGPSVGGVVGLVLFVMGGSTTVIVGVVVGGSGGGVVEVMMGGSVTPVPLGVTVTSGTVTVVGGGTSGVVEFGRGRTLVRISSISLNRELRGSDFLVVGSGARVVSGASVVMAVVGHSTMLGGVETGTDSVTDGTVVLAWDWDSVKCSWFSVLSLSLGSVVVELFGDVGEAEGVLWTTPPLGVGVLEAVLESVGNRFSMTPSTISPRDCRFVVVVAWVVSVSVVGVTSSGAKVMLVNWRLTCRG